ncbi:MAG: hypothetical protein A2161_01425 [Candidatus Schekmanbacteria bacterium RBG_13_48_7]|uniref:Uncharacterized protein n=1 Tax=Candidatus Schekmanbacteria bacterium RBG_13_48_7 TaxID=1817878 RepID=A0A1F7RSC5_9BACT|nr:MAG: hypothetical protein A2161_01425 [Candidatus Schekmanbacteria bacterium RBG_13_48_7]
MTITDDKYLLIQMMCPIKLFKFGFYFLVYVSGESQDFHYLLFINLKFTASLVLRFIAQI